MRSSFILAIIALSLAACVDVHNPPPAQQPATVVVPPAAPAATTTVICPAGAISC